MKSLLDTLPSDKKQISKNTLFSETPCMKTHSALVANQTVVVNVNLSWSTTVLVPKTPEALEIIGDDPIKRAKDNKVDVVDMSVFLSKRTFLCKPSVAFSV